MDCETCAERRKQAEPVPFQSHQADMARMERANKRGFILNVILAGLLAASWAGFLIYESQFEMVEEKIVTQEVTQDADNGINRFIGGDFYGEAND